MDDQRWLEAERRRLQDLLQRSVPEAGFEDREVVAWLDAMARSELFIDFDRVMGLGVSAARAGRQHLDEEVLRWAAGTPSSRSLDLLGAFLSGLWLAAFRSWPVDPARIGVLAGLSRQAEPSSDAAYSLAQALLAASEGPGADATARAQVLEAVRLLQQRAAGPVKAALAGLLARAAPKV